MYLLDHEKANVTPRMLYALMVWKDQGRRLVEIKVERKKASVWVYDYDLGNGKYVVSPKDLPDQEELLRLNEQELVAQRERLEKQLAQLGV